MAVNNRPLRRYVMERTPHCEGPKAQVARSNRAGQAKQNKAPAKNLIFFDDRTGLQPQSSLQIVW